MNKITQIQSQESPGGISDDPIVDGQLTELAEILVEFGLRRQRRKGRGRKHTESAEPQNEREIAASD